jgi:capsid protein
MAGAVEWLTVMRRRNNIVTPFCDQVAEWRLDEEIASKRIPYPGGYERFQEEREFAARFTWTCPARPQADDYKTAKAFETRKGMFTTTLAEIHEEYGRDWDDDMRQRAAENALAEELGLPKPWAATDLLQVKGGEDAALKEAEQPQAPPKPQESASDDVEKELAAEEPEQELAADLDKTLKGE